MMFVAQNKPTTEEEHHRAKEREYWKSQLYLSRWLTWITSIGVVGGIVSLWLLKGTLDVTRKELELSERPWVPAYLALDGPFEFSGDGGASLRTKYILTNLGHSVADEVEILVEMLPRPINQENFHESLERQKEFCESMIKSRSKTPYKLGYALFPGETINGNRTVLMKKEDIASSADRMDPRLPKGFMFPVLIGCVIYKFTFSPEYHSTGFIYSLFRFDPNQPEGDFSIEINKTVPMADLKLEPFAFGGRYAD